MIEEPYGCHPAELPGYRNYDLAMLSIINAAICSDAGLAAMYDEWVYGLPDRAAYIQHYVKIFGQRSLDRFRAKSYYSAPADYGVAFSSGWDTNGRVAEPGCGHGRVGATD